MRRAITSTGLSLVLLFAASSASTLAVGPPANDDLADAMAVSSVYFADAPDMTGATLEAGEVTCDETGGQIDQSVWYAFSLPVGATVTIEINGIETGVTAGVYGPFEVAPTDVGDLPDATHCVYGTGLYQALTEWYEPATYLVQLTTVSAWDVDPTIRIEQQPVRIWPWFGSYTVDVLAGVPLYVQWGWLACTRGLATVAPTAFTQWYELRMVDPTESEVLAISPQAARAWWGSVYRDDSQVGTCVVGPGRGWGASWQYDLPPLEPGTYELVFQVALRHTITDGADTLDGDGRPDHYRRGVMGEGVVTINVLPVD